MEIRWFRGRGLYTSKSTAQKFWGKRSVLCLVCITFVTDL